MYTTGKHIFISAHHETTYPHLRSCIAHWHPIDLEVWSKSKLLHCDSPTCMSSKDFTLGQLQGTDICSSRNCDCPGLCHPAQNTPNSQPSDLLLRATPLRYRVNLPCHSILLGVAPGTSAVVLFSRPGFTLFQRRSGLGGISDSAVSHCGRPRLPSTPGGPVRWRQTPAPPAAPERRGQLQHREGQVNSRVLPHHLH